MVTVLLAHQSRLVRQALAKILSIQDGISVVGHAETGPDTKQKIEELRPDVLVVNSNLPRLNGILKKSKVKDDAMVVAAADELGNGGERRLSYDDNLGELVGAVIAAGGEDADVDAIQARCDSLADLTGREREILKLVAEGLSNRQISRDMEITERTVKYHMSNILRKLDLFSRTEAAILFLKGDLHSAH